MLKFAAGIKPILESVLTFEFVRLLSGVVVIRVLDF